MRISCKSFNNGVRLFRFIGDRISFHNAHTNIHDDDDNDDDEEDGYGTVPLSTLHVFDYNRAEQERKKRK